MIRFENLSKRNHIFYLKKYDEAIMDQDIQSHFNLMFFKELDIVDSRYVNLKIVDNEDFIFPISISKGQTV